MFIEPGMIIFCLQNVPLSSALDFNLYQFKRLQFNSIILNLL